MKTLKTTAALLGLGLLLTGCAAEDSAATTQAEALSTSDTWAKAAEDGMSAAFGILHNNGDTPLELTGASDAQGDEIQLHDTTGTGTEQKMAQHDGALIIEPGQDLVLEPGGTHLMYMDLAEPLIAAQTSTLTLEFSDGSSTQVQFEIRSYTGAKESYDDHEHS